MYRVAVFIPGDKYVVVDSGGGTVDLTVHQIRLPEGHLKELYKATGEPRAAAVLTREPFHTLRPSLGLLRSACRRSWERRWGRALRTFRNWKTKRS